MKVAFYTPKGQVLDPIENELRNQGVEVLTNNCDENCDFIFLSTITSTDQANRAVEKYPNIPLVVYNWDQYAWHKTQTRYNWKVFDKLQEKCIEIWVPSHAVTNRIKEYISDTSKCHLVKSYARLFEYPENKISDQRYIVHVMRPYPHDPQNDWLDKACDELQIPLKKPNHKLSENEFQSLLANCTFTSCPYWEASTGGLTLIEAFNLGKPTLVCDSPYMGARDYFGDHAVYFEEGNFEDYKNKIKLLFDNPNILSNHKEFCKQYTVKSMVTNMISRFNYLKNS